MTIDASAPDRAAKRTDLTFLRRRTRPVPSARPAHSAIADFVGGRATAHPTAASSPDLGSSLDLAAPQPVPSPPAPATAPQPTPSRGSSSSLDLGAAPAPSAAPPRGSAAPAPSSTSLDLGAVPLGRSTPSPASPGRSTSLDLSAAPPPAQAAAPAAATGATRSLSASTAARPAPGRPEPRTSHGVPTILNAQSPAVTLTRVQSGVGALTFEAVAAAGIGDLRLGCAYQLRSGGSSTVQHQAGRRFAPPGEARRPIMLAARGQFERIAVDLRQVTELERFVVYAFSGDGQQLRWGGTLLVTTFGGDRIELPIEMQPSTAVAVLASVYNIGGELVLRSEMDLIGRTVRDACRGYGFDRITWLDDVTPVD